MFDIAPTELLLVAFVALVVIGPKDLPKAMRVVGYWVGRARGVARQFRSGFDQMVREAELEEMEKRWAAENERIMREHPQNDTVDPDPAHSHDAATSDADSEATTPGDMAVEPESAPVVHQDHDDATTHPVTVEKPQILPAADPTLHRSEGAPS